MGRREIIALLPLISFLPAAATPAAAGDGAPMPEQIVYTLRFPRPETHYVEVEALVPAGGRDEIELMMAVWTPGSYLVREFARHIEEVRAETASGRPLAAGKSAKNRWRVETGGASTVRLSYRVYCREMSVRTNFVAAEFALLNGAATFLTLADGRPRPHRVHLELPRGWRNSACSLPPAPGGGEHAYLARDFDQLIDSPLYAGNPSVYEFEVGGVPHRLVNEGGGTVWDGPRSAADTEVLVRGQHAFWGLLPYDGYTFLNFLTEAGGGLEHADSSVLMSSRWKSRTREGYLEWLGLVSHELFHAWNGKRLRPAELGPFDYEQEVFTRGLWVVEGVTAYYDDLLVHRAGLSTRKEFLDSFSKCIEHLQTTPGRYVQPLEQASFDAWIKHYRRDENSRNSSVSYYVKGAVMAWLLDLEIRRASGGRSSLDDVLRLAYRRFSGSRGFAHGEFRALAAEVAGTDLSRFFHHTLETTGELDYAPALDWLGLVFTSREEAKRDKPPDEERGWLGLSATNRQGLLVVTGVPRCTPAQAGGVNVDDEIVALDGYRVTADGWEERLAAYRPGQQATLLVARRQQLVELAVTFGAEPAKAWLLEPDPEATPEQQAHLAAWLGGDGGG